MPLHRLLACVFASALSVTAAAQPLPPGITAELVDRARELLRSVPFADGHNDLPSSLLDVVRGDLDAPGADLSRVQMELPADIPRLREGAVGMQFWSAFVDTDFIATGDSLRQAIRQIDVIHRFVERYDDLEFAFTADDIERAHAAGRIASMIGLEGGHAIEGSTAALRMFYELGVRYLTLTHFRTHDWADAATDIPLHRGLSPFGEEVIREMNRLGMFVDLSHVSAETMRDALRISEAPVLYSHSGARAVNAHPRNVPDDVLRLLPANGGVVMMDFIPGYVVPTPPEWLAREGIDAEIVDLRSLRPLDMETILESVRKSNRIVVAEQGWGVCGIGAEISARVCAEAFDYLDAPPMRVSGEDVPMPYAANLEALALPDANRVVEAVRAVCYAE